MLASPEHVYTPNPFHSGHSRHPDPGSLAADPFQSLYDSLSNLSLTANPQISNQQPLPNQLSNPLSNSPSPTTTTSASDNTPIPVTALFPPGDSVIFAHSSFFHSHPTRPNGPHIDLPSPSQVRLQAAYLNLSRSQTNGNGNSITHVPFPEIGLLVKYGPGVHAAAEGKGLLMLRRYVDEEGGIVPEVFGWRRDAGTGEGYLYLALPEGEVLEGRRWEGMGEGERERVCAEVRGLVGRWRRLRVPGAGGGVVGSVDQGPLQDQVLRACVTTGMPAGPFGSVSAFHDYFVSAAVAISQSRQAGVGESIVRYTPHHLFPENVPVVFTHGGLHPRNIIVSAGPNPRVVAIIGWEQAGWYPAYWELCKARWECSQRGGSGEWESRYLGRILDVDELGRELHGWHVGALCQYWDYFVGLM